MKILLLLLLYFISSDLYSQELKTRADSLIMEGIRYHEYGNYGKALECYNKVLEIEPNNSVAMGEKGITYYIMKDYEKSIAECKKSLDISDDTPESLNVYVTLANAYDDKGEFENAIEIYDDAISEFDDNYILYYNKGIALYKRNKVEEAIKCMEKSAVLNPEHPGTQFMIASIHGVSNRAVSIFALTRFLILEPHSDKSEIALDMLRKFLNFGVVKSGESKTTINLDANLLLKGNENNFNSIEFAISLNASKSINDTTVRSEITNGVSLYKLIFKLLDNEKDKIGFYWEYYAPYFIEILRKNYLEVMVRMIYMSTGNTNNSIWIDEHSTDVGNFYNWSQNFDWYDD